MRSQPPFMLLLLLLLAAGCAATSSCTRPMDERQAAPMSTCQEWVDKDLRFWRCVFPDAVCYVYRDRHNSTSGGMTCLDREIR